jgi:hypothetical protein
MDSTEDDDDWTCGIPIAQPTPALKQRAHDLFDPIWQTGLLSRGNAYRLLAAALRVPEPQAHFKKMPRHRIVQAIAILPDLRAALEARLGRSSVRRYSGTPEAGSGAPRRL